MVVAPLARVRALVADVVALARGVHAVVADVVALARGVHAMVAAMAAVVPLVLRGVVGVVFPPGSDLFRGCPSRCTQAFLVGATLLANSRRRAAFNDRRPKTLRLRLLHLSPLRARLGWRG